MGDSAIGGSVDAEIRATPLSLAVSVAANIAIAIFVIPLIVEPPYAALRTGDFRNLASALTPGAFELFAFIGFLVVGYWIEWETRGIFSPTEVWGAGDSDLIARTPGRWLFHGDKLRLEVRSVDRSGSGMVIRGVFGRWWDLARYELELDEDGAEALGPRLADLSDAGQYPAKALASKKR